MSRNQERVLCLLLVGLAGALRLAGLDRLPFSEPEAARGLTAASLLTGQPPALWSEPALHAVNTLFGFLFGLSDSALRLAPALSGTAAVALLWLFRPTLGAVPTLTAQALFAISPTLLAASRSLSAEALAQPLLLLLVWCALRFAATGAGWALNGAAVCAGVLLNLGPAAVSCLLALSLAPAAAWAMGQGVRGAPPARWPARWIEGLVAFLIAFTLGASGLLLYPQGFGVPALRGWAAAFDAGAGAGPWSLGLLKLGGYETAALLAGLPAAVWALLRAGSGAPSPLPLFGLWALGGLVLLGAMGDRGAWTLLPAALPLTVLAGAGLGMLLRGLDRLAAARAGLAAPLLTALLVYLGLTLLRQGGRNDTLPLLLVVTALAAATVIALAPQGGAPLLPRAGAGLLALALALGLNVHSAARAGFAGGAAEWLDAARPAPSLAATLRHLPLLPRGAPETFTDGAGLRVAQEVGPLALWYLRDRAGVTFRQNLEPGPALMLGLRPAAGQPSIQGYTVREVPLDAGWRPGSAGVREWWRWFVLRETFGAAPQERRAVLYQRT